MVNNGASSHKSNYIDLFFKILNLEGHQNRCIGSKVTVILLNEWILPTGGAACGRVCSCSLCSRLVLLLSVHFEKLTGLPYEGLLVYFCHLSSFCLPLEAFLILNAFTAHCIAH